MTETLAKPPLEIEKLSKEVAALRERIEDLEDLLELDRAVKRNAGKPGTPLEELRTELGLD